MVSFTLSMVGIWLFSIGVNGLYSMWSGRKPKAKSKGILS